jgi:hypothetical protein
MQKFTFEDDLQLVGQDLESTDAGPVLGYQVLLVPRPARELEEIGARVGRPVHGHQQRSRCQIQNVT